MMKLMYFLVIPLFLLFPLFAFNQTDELKDFKLAGPHPEVTAIKKVVDTSGEVFRFPETSGDITGLSVSGNVSFTDNDGELRIILVSNDHREFLVYEMYPMLGGSLEVNFADLCEETGLLDRVVPGVLRVEIKNGLLNLDQLAVTRELPPGVSVAESKKAAHQAQNNSKIARLNQNLRQKGQLWVAGNTDVSTLTWTEKKQLYGQSKFPPGIEFYAGGILQTGLQLKAATASLMVDKWDWRNRHGKWWISSVKNQSTCGSCWAFAATGATEAQVNLYFNQLLNLDLSEQDVLSCSGAGTCAGGYPGTALDYIKSTGIVNDAAFPYTHTDQPCTNKSVSPSQLIKIAGRVDFGSTQWPATEDNLKKMIIKYGPLSGGIYDWSHAIVLVGWQVVKAGDYFYTRDLNKATGWITVPDGSPLIGTTVWIFKNSWGVWGDGGYVYVQTSMANVGWTHALLNPITSLKQTYNVVCADNDHDGYYWWGLGPKPAGCNCPDTPDGDDSNPNLGPLDAYGNCTVLGGPPVANFTADNITINAGGSVNFSDVSTGAPTSRLWTFEGGNPATSTVQNPVVTYATAGYYDVTLLVSNANGTSSNTISNYITVNAYAPSYCTSSGNTSKEYISLVSLNGGSKSSGKSTGYENFTNPILCTVSAGTTVNLSLTPTILSKTFAESFSVWIDFNQDKDFSDAGELVFTANKIKSPISNKVISIPLNAKNGDTRMRVSMKRNSLPGSCDVGFNGEVEDYTINITGGTGLKSAAIDATGSLFRLYPNPADTKLTLELGQVFPGDCYSLYSIHGMLISKAFVEGTVTRLDVTNLVPGVYLVEMLNGGNRLVEKFVKQ